MADTKTCAKHRADEWRRANGETVVTNSTVTVAKVVSDFVRRFEQPVASRGSADRARAQGIAGGEKLPKNLVDKELWQQRFDDIRTFERHLARNGTLILKFFLNVSKDEQRRRFLARIDEPAKRWKFSFADVAERKLWDEYMHAYDDLIRQTSRPEAPWFVVPADNKWFTRLVVVGRRCK